MGGALLGAPQTPAGLRGPAWAVPASPREKSLTAVPLLVAPVEILTTQNRVAALNLLHDPLALRVESRVIRLTPLVFHSRPLPLYRLLGRPQLLCAPLGICVAVVPVSAGADLAPGGRSARL